MFCTLPQGASGAGGVIVPRHRFSTHFFVVGLQVAVVFMQGLATPQLPGGLPLQTVDHWSFGMGRGSPTCAIHAHEQGSR